MTEDSSLLRSLMEFFVTIEDDELDPQMGYLDPLVVVLTNCTAAEAPRLARRLVEERHAACVNVIPGVKSFYIWEGKLCEEEECSLFIKTTERSATTLVERLRALHSYKTPEIIVLEPTHVDHAYAMWAREQTTRPT